MTSTYEGYEVETTDDVIPQKRYKVAFSCESCGHKWTRSFKAIPSKNPPCPNPSCAQVRENRELRKQLENMQRMLEEQRPPAHVGENPRVKAIDTTAQIVMEDHKMTDLRDNVRPGETMAPKLPGPLQQRADTFFAAASAGKVAVPDMASNRTRSISAKQMDLIGRRAVAGAYRSMAVPPSTIMPKAKPGDAPLVRVRTEQLSRK